MSGICYRLSSSLEAKDGDNPLICWLCIYSGKNIYKILHFLKLRITGILLLWGFLGSSGRRLKVWSLNVQGSFQAHDQSVSGSHKIIVSPVFCCCPRWAIYWWWHWNACLLEFEMRAPWIYLTVSSFPVDITTTNGGNYMGFQLREE